MRSIAIAALAIGMSASIYAGRTVAENGQPSSPPPKCEIRNSAWCIREGAYEITSRYSENREYQREWVLTGFSHRDFPLIVLEPAGCRGGIADDFSRLSLERKFKWREKVWDRVKVRIKKDESCDLELLIPGPNRDRSGEALYQLLPLIQSCESAECIGKSFGALRADLIVDGRE